MSERTLTAAVQAELTAAQVRPFRLFYAAFQTPWRTWSGPGTLNWGGYQWLSTGDELRTGPFPETVDTGSGELEVTLSGVDPSKVSLALGEDVQGKDVEIWFGFLDANWQVIVDPYLEFAGKADRLSHSEDGKTALLTLSVDTAWADTEPTRLRQTDAQQQALYPGDRFYEFAAENALARSEWLLK